MMGSSCPRMMMLCCKIAKGAFSDELVNGYFLLSRVYRWKTFHFKVIP